MVKDRSHALHKCAGIARQLDLADLAAEVRKNLPSTAASLLVGSAVTRSDAIGDLDVIAFSYDIPIGTDRTTSFRYGSWPVHIVAYHPGYFDLVMRDDQLHLLYYRELRKLRDGYVLFDESGMAARMIASIMVKPPPREQLGPLVFSLLGKPQPQSRAEFLLVVERLAFCWLHSRSQYRYSKPKWLLEDARTVRSPALASLLEALSEELLSRHDPGELTQRLTLCGDDLISAAAGVGHYFASNLADARALLAAGRLADAVWPLRMSGAMLAAARAGELGLRYDGIADLHRVSQQFCHRGLPLAPLLSDLFLLGDEVATELRDLCLVALTAFEADWSDGCEPSATNISGSANAGASGLTAMASKSEFVTGEGVWLTHANGVRYLDAVSGTFNLPLGYNHSHVTAAVAAQLSRLTHLSSSFADEPAKALLKRLLAHAGGKLDTGWVRDCSGSTAVECAVKIAQKHTGGSDVITLYYSHHGQTLFTSAISNDASRRRPFPAATAAGVVRVPAPYCHRCFYRQSYPACGLLCADRIHEIIEETSQGPVAAFLVEPILGNGGNIMLPPEFAARLREYCTLNGILLIADEVQTGLGRTGDILASPASGLDPDIIVLAKGLGGLGLPIGAVLARQETMTLLKSEHSFTNGGNLLAIAAAHATLDILESPGFLPEVRRKSELLGRLLGNVRRDRVCVGDVRGCGFMWGLELDHPDGTPAPELANRAVDLAYQQEQMILRSSRYGRGNVIKVRPALTASETELHEIADRLDRVLAGLPG